VPRRGAGSLNELMESITLMDDEQFEWDPVKAEANFRKHKVRFDQAAAAFDDVLALIEQDFSEDYGEDRFILIGKVADGVLSVVFTERQGRIRIISAREANGYERRNYHRAAQKK
jgi:uncharacterized DUF497 family protein